MQEEGERVDTIIWRTEQSGRKRQVELEGRRDIHQRKERRVSPCILSL
jgi:hypothetical protein